MPLKRNGQADILYGGTFEECDEHDACWVVSVRRHPSLNSVHYEGSLEELFDVIDNA